MVNATSTKYKYVLIPVQMQSNNVLGFIESTASVAEYASGLETNVDYVKGCGKFSSILNFSVTNIGCSVTQICDHLENDLCNIGAVLQALKSHWRLESRTSHEGDIVFLGLFRSFRRLPRIDFRF